ncbi:MAG: C40 family peptidase [Tildeniella nuda ZEHNDER 1965/U140]|nr:C40 family peptidase [Tildeniella nuda ZEHNDER 1965/U140]
MTPKLSESTANSPKTAHTHYRSLANLNLYDSPALARLATQAAVGRSLYFTATATIAAAQTTQPALEVCLCEDDYRGWLAVSDLAYLTIANKPYQAIVLSEVEIKTRIHSAIAFAHAAMAQPNEYLWGGTVAPNYDCSGLMQAAFASVGIWLPRDAYQQEAFTQAIAPSELLPGDLVFFGSPVKATHVGLYLGESSYIHSSGKDQGRNGIGIDRLSSEGDRISQTYCAQLRGAGRVVACYQPQ